MRSWQRIIFGLCAIALLAIAECAWATYKLQGDIFGGAVSGPTTTAPFFDRFDSVVAGSLADRSGIRTSTRCAPFPMPSPKGCANNAYS